MAVTGTEATEVLKEATCKITQVKNTRLARVSRPSDCSTFFSRAYGRGFINGLFFDGPV
jgi:hypothetical protein